MMRWQIGKDLPPEWYVAMKTAERAQERTAAANIKTVAQSRQRHETAHRIVQASVDKWFRPLTRWERVILWVCQWFI